MLVLNYLSPVTYIVVYSFAPVTAWCAINSMERYNTVCLRFIPAGIVYILHGPLRNAWCTSYTAYTSISVLVVHVCTYWLH